MSLRLMRAGAECACRLFFYADIGISHRGRAHDVSTKYSDVFCTICPVLCLKADSTQGSIGNTSAGVICYTYYFLARKTERSTYYV